MMGIVMMRMLFMVMLMRAAAGRSPLLNLNSVRVPTPCFRHFRKRHDHKNILAHRDRVS
jgi:hypothetical protein